MPTPVCIHPRIQTGNRAHSRTSGISSACLAIKPMSSPASEPHSRRAAPLSYCPGALERLSGENPNATREWLTDHPLLYLCVLQRTNPGNARSRCPPPQTAGIRCGHARPCPGGLPTGVPGQEGGAGRAGSGRSGGLAAARMSEHCSGPQRHRQSVTFISNTRSLVTGTFSPILGCLASLVAARITAITTAESRRGCMHMSLDPMTALWLEMNRRAEHKRQFPASGDPSPRRAVRQSRTSRNR